jgi:hypothetical protein
MLLKITKPKSDNTEVDSKTLEYIQGLAAKYSVPTVAILALTKDHPTDRWSYVGYGQTETSHSNWNKQPSIWDGYHITPINQGAADAVFAPYNEW